MDGTADGDEATPRGGQREPVRPRRRLFEFGVLGAALVITAAVATFLFFSGDDGTPANPEAVTRSLYDAVEAGDASAFVALLDPSLRDDPARDFIPFGASAGAVQVGAGTTVEITELTLRRVNEEAGWATINARGRALIDGATAFVQQTIYLRQLNGTWLVSNEAEFTRAFADPSAKPANNVELGPLEPNRPKVGEVAPDFALVDARDPAVIRKLSDFRGQAVMLNWYASWCGPCKAEIPEFQEALDAVGPGLTILGVNYLESAERATGILDIFKAKYPAVLDSDGLVADHYRVGPGIPVTFFIDRDGVLRATRFGQVPREQLPELLAKIGITYTLPD